MAFKLLDDDEPKAGGGFVLLDEAEPPKPMGKEAQAGFLREEMRNADPFTRNFAAAGTALSDLWEGAKQFVGQEDQEQIAANRVMSEEAPVGALAGNLAAFYLPFGVAGNTLKAAAKVGAGLGALRPIEGAEDFGDVAKGKLKSAAIEGGLAVAGQGVANLAGKFASSRARNLALAKAKNAPTTKVLNEALDAGLVVPPSSVKPSAWNVAKEGVAGKIATAQTASNRNADVFERMIRKDLGIAGNIPLTPKVMQGVRAQAYKVGYRPVADLPAINWDQTFVRGVSQLSPRGAGGAVKNPAQAEIDELVGDLTSRGQWTGEQLIHDIRSLREQSRALYGAANRAGGDTAKTDLAKAMSGSAKLLEDLAERNMMVQGANPAAIQNMREARNLIAKAHLAETAILKGGGKPDAGVFAARAQAGKPLSGEMEKIGKFAAQYPKASQAPAKIAGPGVSNLRSLVSLLSGGSGFAMGGPWGAAVMGAAPFVVPPAVRSSLLGASSQNALRDIYRLGLPERTASRLLKYSPVGFTVLGGEPLL